MQIKRNVPARLCFVPDSSTASITVLDKGGAENLPEIQGRSIYKNVSQTIIQTPLIKNSDIDELIQPYIIDKGGLVHEEPKRETRANTFVAKETRLS
ncbi:hypothetical protein NDK43_09325 [Neobacillus pocheonensis]|uniref:Uncharacterized protein n=1 Tax=Neobacillus pocheonensis TaxID=363869 RepID=A0ABT0W969_9BACI|nr:hypothetical protein [Neobacillus pocheonensis]